MILPNQQTHPCSNADMVHGAPKHKVIDWPHCSKSVPNTFPPGKATGNQRQKGHRIQHSGLHDRIGSFGGVFAKSKWRGKTEGFEVWETAKEWLVATKNASQHWLSNKGFCLCPVLFGGQDPTWITSLMPLNPMPRWPVHALSSGICEDMT